MSATLPLDRLARRIADEGPPLVVKDENQIPDSDSALAQLAGAGPRTVGAESEYAFIVEAVREGYLCHYDRSRILDDPDSDLALLAGDLLYAIGIRGLAELEDLESTGILSDLISVAAELQAAGKPDLAEILWLGQIVALSCGKDEVQEAAVADLQAGKTAGAEALVAWSELTAEAHGLGRAFDTAQSAIHWPPSNS